MTDLAVITGTFADFKLIKTRSTAQMIIEIPIEAADAALRTLGGVPKPGSETSVAIARLNPNRTLASGPNTFAKGLNLDKPAPPSLARDAAICCNDERFQRFLRSQHGFKGATDPDEAAVAVRSICTVASRKELDADPAAAERWKELRIEFEGWRG
jgi:hypothetical protein